VADEYLGRPRGRLGEEPELFQHIVYPVRTERNPYARHPFKPEHAGKVVVPASATNTAHGDFMCLYLKDTAGIIVEATGKCNIQFHEAAKQGRIARKLIYVAQHDFQLIDTSKSDGR